MVVWRIGASLIRAPSAADSWISIYSGIYVKRKSNTHLSETLQQLWF